MFLSPTAYSRLRGYHKTTICRLVKRGFFAEAVVTQPNKKRILLDVAKADELFKKNQDPNFTKTGGINTKALAASPAGKNFYKLRTESEFFQAKSRQLAYEQKLGKYISREQVKNEGKVAIKMFKKILSKSAKKTAKLVSKETDEFVVGRILTEEITEALKEMVRQIKRIQLNQTED